MNDESTLLRLEPLGALLERTRGELRAAFDVQRPMRVSRAPGRLDVMGGIADYTGSLVCEMPLDRAVAVVTQQRDDRELQIVSFNLLDEHLPFTFRISLDALANAGAEELRREFSAPGRKWAGYIAGCLFILHESGLIDLRDESISGFNLALYSTIPQGAGVSSSAAIEVATMMNFVDAFTLRSRVEPLQLASLCQQVENRIVGAPCGIMDQVTSLLGESDTLLRLLCQPHQLQPPLRLPPNIRVVGINSKVRHDVAGGAYERTRCAAFMGHKLILERMRAMGVAAGKTLQRDPMNGYLANLDINDYKTYFRQYLPELMQGRAFLAKFGGTIDPATSVQPEIEYHVLGATDHHVLEAHRVRNFATAIAAANTAPPGTREQGALLDRAGHLMYASHLSYTNDARLGAPECDLLVDLARAHERAGIYGARITGGGSGGTVAILCDRSGRADRAINEILAAYARQSGLQPELFTGSSPGAWNVGTACLT